VAVKDKNGTKKAELQVPPASDESLARLRINDRKPKDIASLLPPLTMTEYCNGL
jgi:hypothetical protein